MIVAVLLLGTGGLWVARLNAVATHGPDTDAGPPRWAAPAATGLLVALLVTAVVASVPGMQRENDALLTEAAEVVRAQHPDSAALNRAMADRVRAEHDGGELTVTYRGDSAEIQLFERGRIQRELTVSLRQAPSATS